jgi:hypothetical protein
METAGFSEKLIPVCETASRHISEHRSLHYLDELRSSYGKVTTFALLCKRLHFQHVSLSTVRMKKDEPVGICMINYTRALHWSLS